MTPSILITGTGGMVGSYVDATPWHAPVIKTTRADFDITDLSAVDAFVDAHASQIGAIVHLAAETDVDRCEQDFDHAFCVNTLGTQNMVYQAKKMRVPLLYVSTVGIFGGDGAPGPFHEYSQPHPANLYAVAKLYGERIVQTQLTDWFIVRAGWMMGGVRKDKKFVMKIIKQILDGKRELYALDDTFGSPTYARELLQTVSLVLSQGRAGIYHAVNSGRMSRYDVACQIASFVDPAIRVHPVQSGYFKLPAPRAPSEYAENRVLSNRGLNRMSTSSEALRAYLEEARSTGMLDAVMTTSPALVSS